MCERREVGTWICNGSIFKAPVVCLWGVPVTLYLLDAHLGNGTGHRTATMTAPLLLTSGPVMYETVLHSGGTSPVGRRDVYQLVTVQTHGNLIVLPHWNTRLPAP